MCQYTRKISLDLEHNKIERTPHRAYSPDISPSDLWLFGLLKEKLKEQELSTSDEITEEITTVGADLTFEELRSVSSESIQRLTWAVENGRVLQ
jgi:hypothetical protein